jgi:hypothetical protein
LCMFCMHSDYLQPVFPVQPACMHFHAYVSLPISSLLCSVYCSCSWLCAACPHVCACVRARAHHCMHSLPLNPVPRGIQHAYIFYHHAYYHNLYVWFAHAHVFILQSCICVCHCIVLCAAFCLPCMQLAVCCMLALLHVCVCVCVCVCIASLHVCVCVCVCVCVLYV